MTRQEANRLILKILAKDIEDQPDIRFSQLMRNIGIVLEDDYHGDKQWVEEFNLESTALLKRIQDTRKSYGW